jgi:SAM-dependent methyltransferase
MPFIGDSGSINFLSSSFDVILNFYFLDRRLFFLYERVLKTGGVLIFETPSEVSVSTDFPEEYLLTKNEILQVFPSWDILYRNKVRVPSESRGMKVIEKIILRKV